MILLAIGLGLIIGSFLNVCIDRLPRGESVVVTPSHCEVCGHRLGVWDLIPVISFLWLRGRCRYCQAPLLWRLPVVEAIAATAFALVWVVYGLGPRAFFSAALLSLLIVIAFIDLEQRLILNRLVYPGVGATLLVSPFWPGLGLGGSLLGAGIGLATFSLFYFLSGGGMGAGDVKLAALVGAATGFPQVLTALFAAVMIGGVVAVTLLALRQKARRDAIPFGPFLALGGALAIYWGQSAIAWYLAFLS